MKQTVCSILFMRSSIKLGKQKTPLHFYFTIFSDRKSILKKLV
ncbi:hypothetical protein LEP1GSC036_1549 [Leptospira weilii str. 2006001853]|uniref:Uncharacterized protein n=2 Tax=Leptospira weilii TaxID=28184 RepID=A0A828YY17_9LEPT|nr:hypothetical protein LEP1GSC036_1549 [Leptospira weilii str. 2006001853]EMJ62630.1 hypothetical protein LEP1GSC051_0732 [Leptospira sp. P2653]EMN42619.1 hypothetical protein LEP1GSC086_1511 [Leptospira weilii str. LNT 1234]EMN89076.1 hypothetical protein LEP1GSC108_3670 [Leptospira weilii str. UI 13098]